MPLPQPPAKSLPSQEAYTLGGGDTIRIDILEVPQFSGEYQIPPDGVLTLPLIGSLSVEGLTLEQARQTISNQYSRFLKQPLVTVILLTPRPISISVSGEVNSPGHYPLVQIGEAGIARGPLQPTVTRALAEAGGITLSADIRRVQIRRRQNQGSEQVFTVNLWELMQTGNLNQALVVRDGDTIFVPTATQTTLQEMRQIAATAFAPAPDVPRTVAVVGEVTRPGTYTVVGENPERSQETLGFPTVTLALKQAGGIKPMADIRQIQIRRVTKAGTEQVIPVDLWQLLQVGDFTQDAVIQEGDTIIVPTATEVNPTELTELARANFAPDTIQVSVVGEVVEPGIVQVPPNTPLNQGILAAGGFNHSRARSSSVELIRLNPDGTVAKRTVPIDFAQGINEQSNPVLQNNDIIIVGRSGIAKFADTFGTALAPSTRIFDVLRIVDFFGIWSSD
ncbi:Polysaccharide biosynthesis/export protein [Coleofasciculus chthonoplastes PCC 7420]|uniref:Polysaccharide biosynthesis/export protein n=1 Tax=Coleofasciculus chthonoplastes PCC 7420 TaxID=118168 RepID=B4VTH5_9CYAN|nr:SLBB domain-containing protein [Coleofasciculus chthonoplastes]EDX74547.1 Polysaccharide biosynthesis/export protein [Coleofasciculus chthonoplastes PCC 7420]